MKYLIFSLILFYSVASQADVYIVTDKDTKEVVSVSNEGDCVLQPNMELTIDKSIDLKDIALASQPTMYKYDKGKFTANMSKLQAKETEELQEYEKAIERDKIDKRILKIAADSLKAEGILLKYEHGGK